MYTKQAHDQYKTVQFTTIDRGRLLLMMYEGGLKFLQQAKDALETRDVVKFSRFLSKGQAVIAELMNTLDFDKGGQIAKDLDRLYDFMLFYLTEANLHKDPEKIQRVIRMLETLSEAYHEIIENGKAEKELSLMGTGSGKTPIKPTALTSDNDPEPTKNPSVRAFF